MGRLYPSGVSTATAVSLLASYLPGLDATVLVFTVALSLLAGVFFGLIPVLTWDADDRYQISGTNV